MSDAVVLTLAVVLATASLGGLLRSGVRRRSRVRSARVGPRPRLRRLASLIVAASVAVGALALGLATLLVAVGGLVAVVLVRGRRRRRLGSRRAAEAALPEAIDLLIVAVHAGLSPRQAIAELAAHLPAPVRPGFDAVTHRLHRGAALADAIGELPRIIGPQATPVAVSIAQADRDGLPLGAVLDRLADEGRQLRRRHAEAEARRLPVRLSFPLVVCTLPSFVLLVIAPAVLGAISSLRDHAPP